MGRQSRGIVVTDPQVQLLGYRSQILMYANAKRFPSPRTPVRSAGIMLRKDHTRGHVPAEGIVGEVFDLFEVVRGQNNAVFHRTAAYTNGHFKGSTALVVTVVAYLQELFKLCEVTRL